MAQPTPAQIKAAIYTAIREYEARVRVERKGDPSGLVAGLFPATAYSIIEDAITKACDERAAQTEEVAA